tara:strand:+ start:155 stop:373 length:219 start_codon:yes stop_codon:yes gene_type:complete
MRRLIKRVLFGRKRRKNYKQKMRYNYVTWNAHNKLQAKLDNLMRHLKLESVGGSSIIGDSKDVKKFRNQFDY